MSCTVCNHPERQTIDQALLAKTATLNALSQQHGLSPAALHRHKQHLLKKMTQAQNRLQDSLRQASLFKLNIFLEAALDTLETATADGNSRMVLQAAREGTRIIKFMAKLDFSFDQDTVYRLLASPQWASQGSLLPTDPQFLSGSHQHLADSLLSLCPEAPPPDLNAPENSGSEDHEAAPLDLTDLDNQSLELLHNLFPGLSQVLPATPNAKRENQCPKRKKSGKKAIKLPAYQKINEGYQLDNRHENNSEKSPGKLNSWVRDLDEGRLNLDTLNAIGAGRLF